MAVQGLSNVDPLVIHHDRLSTKCLDLKDDHVKASLGLFMIHNVVRRNLLSCAQGARTISDAKSADSFAAYATYTLFVTRDQLESVDEIWFPEFSKYDAAFDEQVHRHQTVYEHIETTGASLRKARQIISDKGGWEDLAVHFETLHGLLAPMFDEEESLANGLGHRVPLETIAHLNGQQDKRRLQASKTHGQLWSVVYLLRSLKPSERDIFPPGLPKLVAGGMLAGGAVQYNK